MSGRDPYRFFCEDLSGETVALDAGEARHGAAVLRLRAGQDVALFDGRGGWATGQVVSLQRGRLTVSIGRRGRRERAGPAVTVAFAVPKGKRLGWLLEKATELGAHRLQPVRFQRSVAADGPVGPAKLRRWRAHCIAAAKQSGLDYLPELTEPADLAEFLRSAADGIKILGETRDETIALAEALAERRPGRPIYLLVGPEGGLTTQERRAAEAGGFAPVRLGRTTLRIETAVLALLAGIVAFCEDDFRAPAG